MSKYPERIVCLTEETTETLCLLGEGDRVIGVSGYTVRPPEARRKPKVSAFINARFEKIEALRPPELGEGRKVPLRRRLRLANRNKRIRGAAAHPRVDRPRQHLLHLERPPASSAGNVASPATEGFVLW